MSYFIFLVFSYLCRVFVESTESGTSDIFKQIEDSGCGLSNKHFLVALDLEELCSQPFLNSEGYRNKLHYDTTPLLCTEYYIVNTYMCNLTKSRKNVTLPASELDINNLIRDLQLKFHNNVREFCNLTGKEVLKFSSSPNATLNEADEIFKKIMINSTTCETFCSNRVDDGITDLCNVVIWAWSYTTKLSSDITEGIGKISDESNIEKIPPVGDIHKAHAKVTDEPLKSEVTADIINNKQTEAENRTRSLEMKPKIPDETKAGDNVKIPQNSVKNYDNLDLDHIQKSTESEKDTQLGNTAVDNNKNLLQVIRTKIPSNNNNLNKADNLPIFKKEPVDHENKDNDNDRFGQESFSESGGNIKIKSNDGDNIDGPIGEVETNDKPDSHDAPSVDPDNEPDDFSNQKPDTDEQLVDTGNFMVVEKLPQNTGDFNGGNNLGGYEHFQRNEDNHFFTYFVSMGIVCGIMYILFHNKKKILALAVEGRRGRSHGGGRRRPNTAAYSKLDSNLEEAMVSNVSQASVTHVLY